MKKKILSLILALVMVLPVCPTELFSIEANATQSRSENFSKEYVLTGNYRDDIVAVAMAQNQKSKKDLGYTENWCADFIYDCAKLAGITNYPYYGGAGQTLVNKLVGIGGCWYSYSSNYEPRKGDIVFLNTCKKYASSGESGHVGIVTADGITSKGKVKTIEGNTGPEGSGGLIVNTKERSYMPSNYKDSSYASSETMYVVGYVKMDYCDHKDDNGKSLFDDKGICTNTKCNYQFPYDNERDTSFAGTYKVKSGATAYIRTGPYQGCTEVTRVTSGTFSVDARVYNCKGNHWYELTYDGETRYVVSSNLEPTGHIHTYVMCDIDSAHPHKLYDVCSCGYKRDTGKTQKNENCTLCYPPDPYASKNPDDYDFPTRSLNYTAGSATMTGSDVAWVQAVLYQLGYSVSIDGKFGPSTRDIVKKFQGDYGLAVDGSCGPATRAKLKELWEAKKAGSHTHSYSTATCTSPKKCTICGATTGSALGHTYSNACDTTCNRCGATRSITHSYSNNCDTSCNVCGATRTITHSYSNACDASCNTCGATRTPAAHVYTNACDEYCNVCFALRSVPGHSYDNACDATCNRCGATRTPSAHVYTNACDEYCNVCFALRSVPGHSYDNACDASCNRCGATRTVTHSYTTVGYDKTHPHNEYKRCSCGAIQYTGAEQNAWDETLHHDEAHPHSIYKLCIPCGWKKYTGQKATVSTCVDCYPGGTTGDCTWKLVGTKLTISGNGAMADYTDSNPAPWGTAITEVVIGNGVTSIGNQALEDCGNLTSVVIPDSVKSIGEFAFYNCKALKSVILGNGIETIGNFAFRKCTALPAITIPKSVTSIGSVPFSICDAMTSITVDEGNKIYHSAGNCLIETSSKTLIQGCKTSVIPSDNSVIAINKHAFYNCNDLTSIIIPDGVTSIGEGAFYNCGDLTSTTIPDSVTSIGDWTFYDCTVLTDVWYEGTEADRAEISIGSDNEYLINATWHYDSCIKNAPSYTHGFDNACDISCNVCGATRTITHFYTTVGYDKTHPHNEYKRCSCGEIQYTGAEQNAWDKTLHHDEAHPHSIYKLCIPCGWKKYTGQKATLSTCVDCYPVGTATISLSATKVAVGQKVKVSWSAVSNAKEYNVKHYDSYNQHNLICTTTALSAEISFDKVGTYMVYVDSVGKNGDYKKSNEISLVIYQPYTVTYDLNGGKGEIPPTVSESNTIQLSKVIPQKDGFRFVGWVSEPNDAAIMTVGSTYYLVVGKSTSYKVIAQWECLTHDYDNNCDSDCNVCGAKRSVSHSYDNACDAECNVCKVTRTPADHVYDNKEDKTCNVCGFSSVLSGITGDCTWTLDGTKLTISGNGAMADYSNPDSIPWGNAISEVVIENGVTSIGDRAFYDCKALKSVTIGNDVETIGNYVFTYCSALTAITIPNSVTTIGLGVFQYCKALESVTLGSSVTTIGNSTFSFCSALTSITVAKENKTYHSAGNCVIETASKTLVAGCKASVIPSDGSVTVIGEKAFSFCNTLVTITIPNSITSIGEGAFEHCTSLSAIVIPQSVNSIGKYAFRACSAIESIAIPKSVTSIGYDIFYDCTALTDIWYEGSEAERAKISINPNNGKLTDATWHYNSCIKNAPSYTHVYDNACDTTCDECGYVRVIAHSYTVQDKSNTEHWMKCSVCSTVDESTRETHGYDNACDITCNECGYVRMVPDHVYDNDKDTDCNECGTKRIVYTPGDLDGVPGVSMDDAIYLLFNINFPGNYPVNQPLDFDGNGTADMDDAIYLLFHVNFSDFYPLH